MEEHPAPPRAVSKCNVDRARRIMGAIAWILPKVVREGKTLAAEFSVSEVKETDSIPTSFFEQLAQAEWRPWCASPEAGGDPVTPIYSGLTQHKGMSTLYGAIGSDGQWQRVHVLESGGAAHDAEVLEALKKERWKPSTCSAVPIMVDTVFRR